MTTTFSINGKPYTVNLANLPADITLNTFIREHAGLPATKFMCQEGGCGVCICVVTAKHPATGVLQTWAVNSCLTLVNSCAGWEITTSEGLGSKHNGYHPIQKRLAKMNGTQCGYCSPGFVMNMFGLLESKNGKVTMAEVENAFGGNICRCTGYRPILDAMKSFATDSTIEVPAECRDIEDLSAKTCPKTGSPCSGSCKPSPKHDSFSWSDGTKWFWPKSLADVFRALNQLNNEPYTFVAGNTAHGVYRRSADVKNFIDLNGVPELYQHKLTNDTLTLGGNLSLTETMGIFETAAKKPGFEYCQQLWQHFDWIANVPVRNMGTLAGNLAIKHQNKEFPSDIYVVFAALDVQVVVSDNVFKQQTLTLDGYLKTPMNNKVLTSFVLKAYPKDKYIFDSYKIMPRAQNAHAYVNAAFLVDLDKATNKVNSSRLCFGGINPDFTHATAIEELLKGKQLYDQQVWGKIFASFNTHFIANSVLPDPSPEYRQKLAYNLLYKFLLKHAPIKSISDKFVSGGELLKRPVSSGKQEYETVQKSFPIGQPIAKIEGLLQTSGEAAFANDLPVQPQQVWAAFVTAKKIGATVTGIDATDALALPGVVALFTAKDIPGKNVICEKDNFFFMEDEAFLLSGPVNFYDEPVAVIVAESNDLAARAAELVKISYSGGSAEILPSLQSVLNNASSDRLKHSIKSLINELDVTESYDVKASGKLDAGLQYHFFMEPQTTVVVPIEAGLEVHSSTQWMDYTQLVIANLLNLRTNEVQVKVRRIGGGYGGKATRSYPAACAAALAAYRLNRPVRFVQSLESMMNSLGKRWAMHVDYEFYAKNTGKIVAIKSSFYEDAGFLPNESPMGHTQLLSKNVYLFSDNYKLDGYAVITDSVNNTACRAPGSIEGIAIMENIIEHIAFETGVDPVDVRLANMIPNHKMQEMLPPFVKSTNYKARRQEITVFNEKNRWRKRGLGLGLLEYHVGYFGQYPATLAVYHSDGTVIVSHGGIEMGQGMNTKIAQVVAHDLGISVDFVKVEASNTVNGANAMVTGGSVGSEAVCFAIRKCCNTLKDRLAPIKETVKDASWPALITAAYNNKVNLIVSDDCKPGDMDPYTVCGVAITEVEVDILTGNYLVTRVDLLEDTGESLSPAVDIGQIEGAFMMGLGYWTSEQIVVDETTGQVKTNRSWNYKPPGAKDIPIDFRIQLLPRSSNTGGFMRSKATGEPSICLAVTVAFALQHALQSARDDAGLKKQYIPLIAPMTPEYVLLNAGTDASMLTLQ